MPIIMLPCRPFIGSVQSSSQQGKPSTRTGRKKKKEMNAYYQGDLCLVEHPDEKLG